MVQQYKKIGSLDLNILFRWTLRIKKAQGDGNTTISGFIASLKALFISIIFQKGNFKIVNFNDHSKILFYLADGIVRQDIYQMMNNAANYIGDRTKYDFICWQNIIRIRFFRLFVNLYLLPYYYHITSQLDTNISLRLLLTSHLFEIKDRKEDFEKVTVPEKYNLCVVNYDAYTFGNYIVQYFNHLNISTATLQHGVMLAKRVGLEHNPDYLGVEFECSIADYFLAWNEFTMNEAIKNGMDPSKIRVLGQCKKNFGHREVQINNNHKIGVILDGIFEKENNVPIINIVDAFALRYGYNYCIRLHPNFKGDEYDNIIGDRGEVCNKGKGLVEFFDDLEFAVVANSTTLFEIEDYRLPFLRYSSNNIKDKFRDYNAPSFRNLAEMCSLFNNKVHITWINNVKQFSIENRYNAFFSSFLRD